MENQGCWHAVNHNWNLPSSTVIDAFFCNVITQFWHVLVRYQCLDMFGHNMQAYTRFTIILLRMLLLPQSLCENMRNRAEETMVTLGMSAHTDRLMKLMVENGVTNTAVMERLNGEPRVMSRLGFWVEGGVSFRPTPHIWEITYVNYINDTW